MPINGLTCGEFCRLLCRPPCPSSVAKRMFRPPNPTYSLVCDENGAAMHLHLTDGADWHGTDESIERIEVFRAKTWNKNRIVCMFVEGRQNPHYTILYSHCYNVDIGMTCNFLVELSEQLNCNVLGYDYSGYGCSTGKPSENNLHADVEAAWDSLKCRYKVHSSNTILFGKFIGTIPTIYLAGKHKFAAAVLQAPLLSGIRLIYPQMKRTWFWDSFVNYEAILKVDAPTLVMHGEDDKVVDFCHGNAIRLRCPGASPKPLFLHGVGHDMESCRKFFPRLRTFIAEELQRN